MLRIYTLFLFLLLAPALHAQSVNAYKRAADDAMRQKDYFAASKHYATVLERRPDDRAAQYGYAEAARLLYAYAEAEKMYRQLATDDDATAKFPLLHYRIGEVEKSQGQYGDAITSFEKFLAQQPAAEATWLDAARREIEASRWAREQAAVKAAVEVMHPGREINSPYSDFAPYVVGDTLVYSSYRFDPKTKKGQAGKLTKLMVALRGGRGREPGRGWPNAGDTAHVAHTAITPDGHFMFFTVCKNRNAQDIRCELWLTVKDRRNRWMPAMRLPAPVNVEGVTTTQPSVGYDAALRAPVLYFASDRPGGQGGLDIWSMPLDTVYFCPCNLPLQGKKMPPPAHFKEPVNLTAVNTPQNDGTPFFHAPTQTLYLATEGRTGFGGYDLFYSHKTPAGFSEPKNAGAGFNTSYNDLYPFVGPDGKSGYLSSNRPGSFYLDDANKACCNDIFAFKLPKPIKPPTRDTVPAVTETPPPPRDTLPPPLPPAPPQLKSFVGLPLYFDNDEPDKRTQRTTTKKTYEETALAYLARQEEYRTRFAAGMRSGADRERAENAIDEFFDNDVRTGLERLTELCELLRERLEAGDRVTVMIKGFTSPRARSDYNLNLGRRRISSVRNYMAVYDGGVLARFLQNGQLRVEEASFGETTARAGISDKLDDERNSIYHPDAAKERRVEIVEIREGK